MKSILSHNMMKRTIQKKKCRYFTLLEILVCFVLIGMVSGIILSWGSSLVQHHRFRHSIQGLSSRLALCKEIATCYQTDVVVVIKNVGKSSIELTCTTLEKIHPLQGFLYKKKIYHGIKQIFIDEQEIEPIYIQFFSNICPQKKITFCSYKNEKIEIDIRDLLISTK